MKKTLQITQVQNRDQELLNKLFNVWKKSVKATHLFLSAVEIDNIAEYVPNALKDIKHLIIVLDNIEPVAFMGIDKQKLEMLFILPSHQAKGLGKQLINYALENYNINELSVNEQNPKAKGFYEHMGFVVYKRSDLDEQGMPYPILYMTRKK